jgi:hypothetical protein
MSYRRQCHLSAKRKGSLTTNELFQITVPLDVYHICWWWVANLIWVINLVGFDVPHLAHVLPTKVSRREFMSLID